MRLDWGKSISQQTMTQTLKNKIKNAVKLYKNTFVDEYHLVVKQIADARANQKTDYGEVINADGDKGVGITRELFRTPEKLYFLIIKNLSDNELKVTDSKEYSLWFLKAFPEFKMTKHG